MVWPEPEAISASITLYKVSYRASIVQMYELCYCYFQCALYVHIRSQQFLNNVFMYWVDYGEASSHYETEIQIVLKGMKEKTHTWFLT